ncbi:hypothetical protein SKP52_07815 [Sphingopyxis fribergensis]|uniref:Uncharacterized protein n=1 Tax=Sphingopyxis fribergensis TaxID=1515612 RepID=A0A0A7PKK8_9SPHN|nr:hypothetical protein [Sphingopyxis fribergensis]AJA08482.1 hypothetical protein SKP52_07815 [Sphingopyxis fribergensis]
MSLTRKDGAKVAAGLLEIRGRGHDASAVQREAAMRMRNGTPAKIAFAAAFDNFVATTPSMGASIRQVGRLIEASSLGTVARYNVALRQYLETGDDSALAAMVPTMVKDATDLARRTGEAVPEFGPEVDEIVAANAPAPPPPTDVYVNSSQARPASFQFAAPETAPAPQGNL